MGIWGVLQRFGVFYCVLVYFIGFWRVLLCFGCFEVLYCLCGVILFLLLCCVVFN